GASLPGIQPTLPYGRGSVWQYGVRQDSCDRRAFGQISHFHIAHPCHGGRQQSEGKKGKIGLLKTAMQDSPGDVTLLLAEMKSGNSEALPKLIPLVYHELKRLAAYFLREEREGHTLQATALVNEAYLRLAGRLLAGFLNRDDGIVLYSLASRTFRKLTGTGQTRCGSATAAGYCFW